MTTVKTIEQSGYAYNINRLGGASYRISYINLDGKLNHVDHVFDSVADAEDYIHDLRSSNALCAMLSGKGYNAKYQRANIRRVVVKVNRKTNQDIAEHLDKIDNVNGYILDLIRKDMTDAK